MVTKKDIDIIKDIDLATRLEGEMKRQDINARELAKKASVGQSFVYDILKGKSTNPTIRKLFAVAEVLQTDVPYLLYGKEHFDESFSNAPLASSSNSDELINIPSLILEAYDDNRVFISEDRIGKPYYFHKSWVEKKLNTEAKNLRIMFIEGDSMSPTLGDGDMAMIDTSKKSPTPPGLFAIYDGMGLVVKRLEYINSPENPYINIISDNKNYKSYERKAEHVTVIGKAVWISRELG